MIVSVIVCTYNRAVLLERLLQSLSALKAEPEQFEIIVVDNNSTDETRHIAESFENPRIQFNYFFEARQGLSHARNRGWQEAKGEYVAFLDDEFTVPENWMAKALNEGSQQPQFSLYQNLGRRKPGRH